MDETYSFRPLAKMMNKFEEERGHELEVKRTRKKKDPLANNLSVDEKINL